MHDDQPLTDKEMSELTDLERWMDDLLVKAGMKLSRSRRDTIIDSVLGSVDESADGDE